MKHWLSIAPFASLIVSFVLPSVVMAQQYFGPVDTFFIRIVGFINSILIPLIFTASLLMFIYGMFQYFILNGDNEKSRESGQAMMISAVIGFVLMVSIWAIVNLISSGLFGTTTVSPRLPGIPTL
jgi:Type IV secretion system pilin